MANSQANSICIVVRAPTSADEAAQPANFVGAVTAEGKYTSLNSLPVAKSKFGVQPRILGAPRLDTPRSSH